MRRGILKSRGGAPVPGAVKRLSKPGLGGGGLLNTCGGDLWGFLGLPGGSQLISSADRSAKSTTGEDFPFFDLYPPTMLYTAPIFV